MNTDYGDDEQTATNMPFCYHYSYFLYEYMFCATKWTKTARSPDEDGRRSGQGMSVMQLGLRDDEQTTLKV